MECLNSTSSSGKYCPLLKNFSFNVFYSPFLLLMILNSSLSIAPTVFHLLGSFWSSNYLSVVLEKCVGEMLNHDVGEDS